MTVLITSDLHLDDNPKNSDRWNIFSWLRTQAKKTGAKQIIFCGDNTDAKDRHSSKLVNRFCNELHQLSALSEIIILTGNHDYLDSNQPFFAFTKHLERSIDFITKPTYREIDDGDAETRTNKMCLFLPCTRDYEKDWAGLNFEKVTYGNRTVRVRYIFCHQTFDGALSENGTELRGIPPAIFKDTEAEIISGDIHTPQQINKHMRYVGMPYRKNFGDTFTPRALLLKKGQILDIHYKGQGRELIAARTLEEIEAHEFEPSTQVKIRVNLKRQDLPEWPKMRQEIKALVQSRGWELCGLESIVLADKSRALDIGSASERKAPEDIVKEYAAAKKLKNGMRKAGLELLEEAL